MMASWAARDPCRQSARFPYLVDALGGFIVPQPLGSDKRVAVLDLRLPNGLGVAGVVVVVGPEFHRGVEVQRAGSSSQRLVASDGVESASMTAATRKLLLSYS